jgi:hypothetical protein
MYELLFMVFRKLGLAPFFLAIHPRSALKSTGWLRSFRTSSVIDNSGKPIPWWTYSFIDFIDSKLEKPLHILEFGCGNSTIWLSNKGMHVTAFEDYPEWAKSIRPKLKSNSKIIEVDSIPKFDDDEHLITGNFDVLIIDNLGNRMETAKKHLKYLTEQGVVIWDNTDGPDWLDIKNYMSENGFKAISFTGMIPQELNMSKTTLFYKSNNCLNI